MVLLLTKKEIISRKELNRRIKIVKTAKWHLDTEGIILWGGEEVTAMNTLYNKAVEVIGKKHADRLFK